MPPLASVSDSIASESKDDLARRTASRYGSKEQWLSRGFGSATDGPFSRWMLRISTMPWRANSTAYLAAVSAPYRAAATTSLRLVSLCTVLGNVFRERRLLILSEDHPQLFARGYGCGLFRVWLEEVLLRICSRYLFPPP